MWYKKWIFLFVGIISCSWLQAQDVIYKTDGEKVQGKVLVIGADSVTYTTASNPNTVKHTVHRSQISLVVYANGEHEVINAGMTEAKETTKELHIRHDKSAVDSLAINYRKNLFAFSVIDIFAERYNLSYERIFLGGKLGVKIPYYAGYRETKDFAKGTIAASGLSINFYPKGQGKYRYFVGPTVEVGKTNGEIEANTYDQWGNILEERMVDIEEEYYGVFLTNGIWGSVDKMFGFKMYIDIGRFTFAERESEMLDLNLVFDIVFKL